MLENFACYTKIKGRNYNQILKVIDDFPYHKPITTILSST